MVDAAKLRQPDGYKHIFACLQSIEKVSIVKRMEAFDRFFAHCHRRRGQTVDSYIHHRKMDWSELQDIAEGPRCQMIFWQHSKFAGKLRRLRPHWALGRGPRMYPVPEAWSKKFQSKKGKSKGKGNAARA